MRKLAFFLMALGALTQTAYAESTTQKPDHAAEVRSECTPDVEKLCKGTTPGNGSVQKCMAEHFGELSGACVKALAEPKPAVFSDGANAKSKHINMRLIRYIEMFLAGIDPDTGNIIAACYGSYAIPNPPANRDTAPQALVQALNMNEIRQKYGVLGASLNGPKLSIADYWDIDVGETRQFGGMNIPWTAQLNLGKKLDVNAVTPYEPKTIARKSAVHWNKGSKVMVLDSPDGNVWIMKGFQLGLKPQHSYEEFLAAGQANFKKLPPGWKVRVVTLKQDNHEVPEGGVATILSDEFFNVYDKTGPGMSNYKP